MLRFAQGRRVIDEDGWLALPPAGRRARAAIVGIDERVDRDGGIVRARSTPPRCVGAVRPPRRRARASRPSRSRSCGRSPTRSTREPRSQAIAERHPGLPVVSGAALHPAIREYERTTFAVLNAYVSGALAGIEELEADAAGARAAACRCCSSTPAAGRSPSPRPGASPSAWPRRGRPPASPPSVAVGAASGRRRRGHLRHGRHVVRRVGDRARARPPGAPAAS